MSDSFIRYTVNGNKHHSTGDGTAVLTKAMKKLMINTRTIQSITDADLKYPTTNICHMNLKAGDIVKVELIKRRRIKKVRMMTEFKVMLVTSGKVPWHKILTIYPIQSNVYYNEITKEYNYGNS